MLYIDKSAIFPVEMEVSHREREPRHILTTLRVWIAHHTITEVVVAVPTAHIVKLHSQSESYLYICIYRKK